MKITLIASTFALALTATAPSAYAATQGGASCGVEAAADAALQQQIALIDAAKVNVPDFFSGANSCINSNLLQSFNLSNMIPDLAGFMQGGIQDITNNLLSQAKQQVCKLLDQQLEKTIGKMKEAVGNVNSSVGSELASLLGSSTSGLNMPNISGLGQYDFSSSNGVNYESSVTVPTPTFNLGTTTTTTETYAPSTGSSPSSSNLNNAISDFGNLINGE